MTQFIRRSEIRKQRSRTGTAIGLVALSLAAMLFAYVWQRVSLGRQLQRIEQLSQMNHEFGIEGKRLMLEAQSLNSWSAVEKAAVDRLGMVYPEQDQVVAAIMPPAKREFDLARIAGDLFNPVNAAWSQP